MTTLRDALAAATRRLAEAGIPEARLDARLLLQHRLGLRREDVFLQADRPLTAEEAAGYEALLARRLAREPVSRILGEREFWSLPFRLSPDTLDPRPDTETLVEAVLDRVPVRVAPLRLLDLGTGSGCILLALLHELPNAAGLGVDRAPGAARTARENAGRLGLAGRAGFAVSDWATAVRGPFDIVVSNPPYIPAADIAALAPEVRRHDPALALAGGADGLDPYRLLAREMPRLLRAGGTAAFEVGIGQDRDVAALLAASGLEVLEVRRDLGGIGRCVVARARP